MRSRQIKLVSSMKYQVLSIRKIILVLILYTLYFILNTRVYAVSMNSNTFKIESASVNDAAGNKSSTNYKLSDTLGQLAAGQFSSTGYVIKAGFQYLHSIIPFGFSVSSININLGTVIPNTPATATTNLTVSFGGAGQYQVTGEEIGPLKRVSDTQTIPNTSCDGGVNTCTTTAAKPWTSASAYGFGYNMSGQDFPADFTDSTYYRPFPDRNLSESPAVVMSNTNVGKNRQSTVTFKLNVSPIQQAGTYQTVINFIATPSY